MNAPFTKSDGRRTAANFVDCLLGDVEVILGKLPPEQRRDLENRLHATVRADRHIRERFSKKRKREILRAKA